MRESREEEATDDDIVDIDHVQKTVEEWTSKLVNIQCMFDSHNHTRIWLISYFRMVS